MQKAVFCNSQNALGHIAYLISVCYTLRGTIGTKVGKDESEAADSEEKVQPEMDNAKMNRTLHAMTAHCLRYVGSRVRHHL